MTLNLYLNFFSIGFLINFIFYFASGIYILSIEKKSRATLHLGIAFMCGAITALAYTFSASAYNTFSSIHRYFTIIFITGMMIHTCQFIFEFPVNRAPKFSKIAMYIMWTIIIIITALFIYKSRTAEYIFQFSGHYWDFKLDNLSKIIGLVILLYEVFMVLIGIWQIILAKGKDRWALIGIILAMLLQIAGAIANVMSRDGALERELYVILLNTTSIGGYFTILILYINNTKDKTTFMTKIVGISFVTFLFIFLQLAYYMSKFNDRTYDIEHNGLIRYIITDKEYRPADLEYINEYSFKNDSFNLYDNKTAITINFESLKNEYLNSALWERIRILKKNNYKDNLLKILDESRKSFSGYKNCIIEYYNTIPSTEQKPSEKILTYIAGMKNTIIYRSNKIKALPDENFKDSLTTFLEKEGGKFEPFKKAIAEHIKNSTINGEELKNEVLQYLVPMIPPELRYYRKDSTKKHYVSFMNVDLAMNKVIEVGFSYTGYREYIHPDYVKLAIFLFIIVLIILIGFRFFFYGTLVKPLNTLVDGLHQLEDGNLDIEIPIKVEDEIGFITHRFNRMVGALKTAKKQIDDYTNNLEEKVQKRTEELRSAMEELEVMNTALVEARDALWGEMELAKKIQTVLLPKNPIIKGYEIAAFMSPADEVGGDYYDIINVLDRDWVVIGDVSGHGVPAGLIMMMVQTAIQVALIQNPDLPPSELLITINKIISKNIQYLGENKYMTLTVLATHTNGQFIFSGLHQDIMIYRKKNKNIDIVETDGMWIGIIPDINEMVDNNMFKMEIGDTMLLFTDGITEAVDSDNNMFTSEKLTEVFKNAGDLAPCEIKNSIITELKPYRTKDDITLVVLKRKE